VPPTDLLDPPPEAAAFPVAIPAVAPVPDGRSVFASWWPLATSWLLMGLELPAVSAALARLPDPTIALAAYGGVIFPLALLIESPIIMLLSASTALSKDLRSHELVGRFMWSAGLSFTALHALVAWTPLYDVIVGNVLGVPDAIREPARIGLRIMTPWTISIAFRRYQQGLLIRFGRSKLVGAGTAVRLLTNVTVLGLGIASQRYPGYVIGPLAVVSSVMAEAIFAGLCARPIEKGALRMAPEVTPMLTRSASTPSPALFLAAVRVPRDADHQRRDQPHAARARIARRLARADRHRVHAAQHRLRAQRGRGRDARPPGRAAGAGALHAVARAHDLRDPAGACGNPPRARMVHACRGPAAEPRGARGDRDRPGGADARAFDRAEPVAGRARPCPQDARRDGIGCDLPARDRGSAGRGIAFGRVTGLYVGLAAFVLGNVAQALWLRMRAQEAT
jgi:hypothetical protein